MTAHAHNATADIAHEPSRAYKDHGQHSMDEKKGTNIGGVDVACFEVFVDTHLKRGNKEWDIYERQYTVYSLCTSLPVPSTMADLINSQRRR